MIHFVGAGSGAVDLITVRGQKLLEEADIVVYAGSLVNPELLKNCQKDCQIYNSAKMTLEEVMEVMISGEKQEKKVVRLHTGDPCLYGAIKEQMDLLEKNYSDFEMQYHDYIGEQTAFVLQDWERFEELLVLLESKKLLKAIDRLKDRDRKLLFARVFGELTFAELGEKFEMQPKQAEMAYYYVIRKLRKELEVNHKDEF